MLLRLLIVVLLPLAGCLAGVRSADPGAPELVRIDRDAWPAADTIRWPERSGETVRVYFSEAALVRDLGLDATQAGRLSSRSSTLLLGEHDAKLVVLLRDASLGIDPVRRFAAEHEAFHLAAQFYGLRVPATLLEPGDADDAGAVNAFWDEVVRVSRGQASCHDARERFMALGGPDRRHVLARAFWEWPAEYYARRTVLGDRPEQDYLALRARIPSGKEYVAGGLALWALPTDGPQDWRAKVAAGLNPVNALLEAGGCGHVPVPRPFGRVSRLPLLGPED